MTYADLAVAHAALDVARQERNEAREERDRALGVLERLTHAALDAAGQMAPGPAYAALLEAANVAGALLAEFGRGE